MIDESCSRDVARRAFLGSRRVTFGGEVVDGIRGARNDRAAAVADTTRSAIAGRNSSWAVRRELADGQRKPTRRISPTGKRSRRRFDEPSAETCGRAVARVVQRATRSVIEFRAVYHHGVAPFPGVIWRVEHRSRAGDFWRGSGEEITHVAPVESTVPGSKGKQAVAAATSASTKTSTMCRDHERGHRVARAASCRGRRRVDGAPSPASQRADECQRCRHRQHCRHGAHVPPRDRPCRPADARRRATLPRRSRRATRQQPSSTGR